MSPRHPVIEVEHLHKSYGAVTAVADVSFSVADGEIVGILGPNGAGKTTTVESLQGLRQFDGGTLRVLGLDPARDAVKLRRSIGSQLQDSALPERMKVWEALDLFSSLNSRDSDWKKLLDDWGLDAKRDARFGSLSGGQQQRLFVALALVGRPQLVFLDEMTTGLDPASRRVAWDLIRKIREQGATVVLVTHFMDEAETLCDRLVIIDDGVVVAEGSPNNLIERFAGGVRVRFTHGDDLPWLASVPYVEGVSRERNRFVVVGGGPVLAHVAAALVGRGIEPADLRVERATLEDVFLQITSKGQAS